MAIPRFGLNRFDARTVDAFAADVRRAESLGWDARDPSKVGLGAVFHTVLVEDPARALTMGKSMAAGYYEYSPMLFDPPGLTWSGPDPEKLKRERNVFPDFHHAPDLEASGKVVDCLRGGPAEIVAQLLLGVLRAAPAAFDYVCLHRIPNPTSPDDPERGFMARVAREVLPSVRTALASGTR